MIKRFSTIRQVSIAILAASAFGIWATSFMRAQSTAGIHPSLVTPDKVVTSIGTLGYTDGAPSKETVTKARVSGQLT